MKLMHKLLLLITTLISTATFADWSVQEDNWYSVTIDGVKSGWSHKLIEVDSETNNIKSREIQNMTLSRGGMEITIKVTSTFLETASGDPISAHSTQEAMGMVQESTWVFGTEQLEMTTAAGGEPIVKKVPLPKEPWLTPQAVKRMFKKKMGEGAKAITYQTMASELGPSVITVMMTKSGESTLDVLGNKMNVIGWETVNDKISVKGTEFYTDSGLHVGSKMNAGFGAIENKIMSKYDAMSPINEVPEMMVSLFVEPNKPIANDLSTLTMLVKTKNDTKVKLPSVGMQHATSHEDGTATLVVDLESPIAATKAELTDKKYLDASAICDGTDEAVIAIATGVLASLSEDSDDSAKALALRSAIHEFIEDKNMSTAFASASQVARSKEGDCSEHAVLLCGVLRAADIPSRGVMGMVYAPTFGGPNGAFGWHMWSQALIDGRWVDLDATLKTPYSVGHIATLTSSLSDEDFAAEMAGIIETIGNLEVEIIDEEK